MNKSAARAFAALVFTFISLGTAAAQPTRDEVARQADDYLQAQFDAGFFNGAALIARDGVTVFAKGYGYANAEWEIPNSVSTRFRIASITKTFTAALILKQAGQGRLDVNDAVGKHFQPCPESWGSVTLHHLLTHTSGIPNYTSAPDFATINRLPHTAEQIVATFRDKPLEFAPGAKYSYSNSNYLLLALILEKVSGASYEQLLHRELLDPLELKDTGIDRHSRILLRRASGYRPDGTLLANAEHLDMVWVHGSGAMYSTVEDLLEWNRALHGGRVLAQNVLEKMWQADKGDYGYGWQVLKPSPMTFGRPLLLHAGGLNGFATDLLHYPGEKVTIVILANLMTSPMLAISRDLAAITFGEKYTMPVVRKAVTLDPAIYDAYAGDYVLSPQMTINVRREGDRLIVQAQGQQADVAIPESETRFFSRLVDAQVTFVKDGSGKVTQLIIHQNGRDMPAPRRQP